MKLLAALLLWIPMWFASLDFNCSGQAHENLRAITVQIQETLSDIAERLFSLQPEDSELDAADDDLSLPEFDEPTLSEPPALDPLGVDVSDAYLSRAAGLV